MSQDGTSGFTERSLGKSILLFIVTVGLYGIYWLHQMNEELQEETGEAYDPTMRTVGMLIPLYNIYVMWKFNGTAARALDKGQGMLFALWLFLAPVWWYMVQSEANSRA